MNASESFEIAAKAFRDVSGHLAPGKNGCTHSPECEHDWKIWCAAVEYMKECRPEIEDSLIAAVPSEMSHTPGPWSYVKVGDGIIRIDAPQGPFVGTVRWSDNPHLREDRAIANACLMAAAPDMLEVLKEVASLQEYGLGKLGGLARAVVDKAEGKDG